MVYSPILIEFNISTTKVRPFQIAEGILNPEKWTEFTGWAFLPGIKSCTLSKKTEDCIGTVFSIINTDGSTHKEEILEWDIDKKITIKMSDFSKPLSRFADHFIETWDFQLKNNKTVISRKFQLYPKNHLGSLILRFISPFFKKAVQKHFENMSVLELEDQK